MKLKEKSIRASVPVILPVQSYSHRSQYGLQKVGKAFDFRVCITGSFGHALRVLGFMPLDKGVLCAALYPVDVSSG